MANQQKQPNGSGDWSWPLIILCLCSIFPLGLLLLFFKLFGSDAQKSVRQAPPLRSSLGQAADRFSRAAARQSSGARQSAGTRQSAKTGRSSRAAKTAKKVTRAPALKKSNAWLLKIAGGALAVFGCMIVDASGGYWWELSQGLAILLGGCAMVYSGFSMDRALKRYTRYLLVMGDREAVPVEEIARTLGYSERRVARDLEKMIDKGYFGGKAYVNMELGYLFRGSGVEAGWQRRQAETCQAEEETVRPPREAEEGYSGILRSIRRANDQIADPVLSAKVNRLEEITAKIFRAVEEDPRKADRIGTFLNYYLPTTQKLLNSYASFESAGIEGENLRQAKQRIETAMDAIVQGFEHQLDQLYQADVMDIDSDIRVMEHMLRRDTGSAAQDFGLDGGALREE